MTDDSLSLLTCLSFLNCMSLSLIIYTPYGIYVYYLASSDHGII